MKIIATLIVFLALSNSASAQEQQKPNFFQHPEIRWWIFNASSYTPLFYDRNTFQRINDSQIEIKTFGISSDYLELTGPGWQDTFQMKYRIDCNIPHKMTILEGFATMHEYEKNPDESKYHFYHQFHNAENVAVPETDSSPYRNYEDKDADEHGAAFLCGAKTENTMLPIERDPLEYAYLHDILTQDSYEVGSQIPEDPYIILHHAKSKNDKKMIATYLRKTFKDNEEYITSLQTDADTLLDANYHHENFATVFTNIKWEPTTPKWQQITNEDINRQTMFVDMHTHKTNRENFILFYLKTVTREATPAEGKGGLPPSTLIEQRQIDCNKKLISYWPQSALTRDKNGYIIEQAVHITNLDENMLDDGYILPVDKIASLICPQRP